MIQNSRQDDLSYFKLSLQSFINEVHPELTTDTEFIHDRSELAAQAYDDAFLLGCNTTEAIEIANKILFEGLLFSKFEHLFNIVVEEFFDCILSANAREFALRMIPVCNEVFAKYPADTNGEVEHFDDLYTELVGTVQIYIEENGLQ